MVSGDIAPIVTVAAAIGGNAVALVGLGWWLSGRFRKTENIHREMLAAHELRDQERHEENLGRFSKISVALAQLGHKNGP